MTKFMEYITEHVIGRVHIKCPRLYKPLDIELSMRSDDDIYIRYRLILNWNAEVTCKMSNPQDMRAAKERLIEHLKYALYEDVLSIIYELRNAIHNNDMPNALIALNDLESEVVK